MGWGWYGTATGMLPGINFAFFEVWVLGLGRGLWPRLLGQFFEARAVWAFPPATAAPGRAAGGRTRMEWGICRCRLSFRPQVELGVTLADWLFLLLDILSCF